jgi:hypothetical protein
MVKCGFTFSRNLVPANLSAYDTLLNPPTLGFGPRRFGRRIAAFEGGEAVKDAAESERPIVPAARSAGGAPADGSVPIEIDIGEAAGATVEERRDAHGAVVAPGQMRGQGSTSATIPPVWQAAPAWGS